MTKAEARQMDKMREIVLLMSEDQARNFARKVYVLQQRYETKSVVETVERAVNEALAQSEKTSPSR